jgi:hypothetical protein
MCVPRIVAKQRLGKTVTSAKNKYALIEELVGAFFFFVFRVISRKAGN